MLGNVKVRLGIAADDISRDALIEIKIKDAENFFLNYCNRKDIPEAAVPLIEQLAISLYEDRRGVVSERMGDTSYTYADSIFSSELRKQLNRYRLVKVI